jgi:hypothetical protein
MMGTATPERVTKRFPFASKSRGGLRCSRVTAVLSSSARRIAFWRALLQ